MTDIIEKLYEEFLPEPDPCETSRTLGKDLYRQDEKLWDEVRPLMSQEAIEELQGSRDAILLHSNLDWFRRGIRTGMSLMMELL